MIKVYVKKYGNYPVSSAKIKKLLVTLFTKKGIISDAVVNVSLVSSAKMKTISQKYLKDTNLHNVLSFPESEIKGNFVYPPDNTIHLGDIIVCYPVVIEEAKKEGLLIEERVLELVEHGALHLLGEHHD